MSGFITRARSKTRHWVDEAFTEGRLFTGVQIGRGNMLARIYQKYLQTQKTGKTWIYQVWYEHGWEGTQDVWRVEFQMRREVLKEFGINRVEDVFERMVGLWAYCTTEWLVLKRPQSDKNVSRWNIKRKWTAVQKATFNQAASPLVRTKVKQGNVTQLLNQAAGLAVSIASLSDHPTLQTTLKLLGEWTEYRLRTKNTSFDVEIENRRNRFLRL